MRGASVVLSTVDGALRDTESGVTIYGDGEKAGKRWEAKASLSDRCNVR